ncbi:MAG: zinc transporter ZupT [Bacteroidales bacterium]
MEWTNIYLAFGLTLFAGLATAVGGAIAFFAKRTNTTFLSYSLGFSAGVMIYISFTEILPQASLIIGEHFPGEISTWLTFLFFIAGVSLTALIDKIVPSQENPHEIRSLEQMDNGGQCHGKRLLRVGVLTAIAIAIHNFPEGIATFMSGVSDITVGISIALAVAIHNIPEGIAVSVPVYYATGSRKKAFWWAALSGLAEPLGALFGFLILSLFQSQTVLGYVFALVAGIMIYIAFDELLPAAHKYGKHHTTIYGLISGIIVIGISLMLL